MIQRIQSIWLFLSAIMVWLTWRLPVYTGIMVTENTNVNIQTLNGNYDWLNNLLTMGSGVLTFAAIFLFKNRKLQIRFAAASILVQVALITRYVIIVNEKFSSGTYSLTSALIGISVIFSIQAIRSILRDQKILAESDRLR
jgi:hypothetical protein